VRTAAYAGVMVPPDDDLQDEDADRDLGTLEAAERELADLERELDGLEGSDDPPGGKSAPREPPT
jgi:hypothetical protein